MNTTQQTQTAPFPESDPLIDEVRAIRRAISEQFGNDVDQLCDYLQQLERQHEDRIVKRNVSSQVPRPD